MEVRIKVFSVVKSAGRTQNFEKRLQDANALGQTSRVQPAFYEEGIKIGAAKKAPCHDGIQMAPRRQMAGQRAARSAI